MIERIMGKVCIHVIKGGTFLDKIIWKDLEKQCTGHNINIRDRVNERILNISPDSLENKKFSPFDSEKPTELSYLDTPMIAKLVSDSVPARRLLWMASGVFDYSLFLYTKRKTGQENARSAITAMRQTVCRQLGYFGEI